MTALALRTSEHCNAVSQLHGDVSRKMWQGLWTEREVSNVPITYITNGVHVLSWMAPEMGRLLIKYLGEEWMEKQDSNNDKKHPGVSMGQEKADRGHKSG